MGGEAHGEVPCDSSRILKPHHVCVDSSGIERRFCYSWALHSSFFNSWLYTRPLFTQHFFRKCCRIFEDAGTKPCFDKITLHRHQRGLREMFRFFGNLGTKPCFSILRGSKSASAGTVRDIIAGHSALCKISNAFSGTAFDSSGIERCFCYRWRFFFWFRCFCNMPYRLV